jgi:hypothetical protein
MMCGMRMRSILLSMGCSSQPNIWIMSLLHVLVLMQTSSLRSITSISHEHQWDSVAAYSQCPWVHSICMIEEFAFAKKATFLCGVCDRNEEGKFH